MNGASPLCVPGLPADRLRTLYGPAAGAAAARRLAMMLGRYGLTPAAPAPSWDQRTALLIAYGDAVRAPGRRPLSVLRDVMDGRLAGLFSHLHLLPFFPSSSDDGFSVVHFREVDPALGIWDDVRALADRRAIMFDLVLNHVSRRSGWFEDYLTGVAPARHYFIEADPAADLSAVARPRTHPLLTRVETRAGPRHVWTTFSDDQVDLNYANPDVLFEMLDILMFYISMGARLLRLDAIAYLWKEPGTPCLHHPKTHEVVKLFRDVLRLVAPDVILLTETNVPHAENVAYFGAGDEAHWVYNFALPPLLAQALTTGDARTLTRWAGEQAAPPAGCAFLNFTASHDGIGVRPAEGYLTPAERDALVDRVHATGGAVSLGRMPDGSEAPYELNTTWFDLLGGPGVTPALQEAAFLCSQTVPLSLRGVPAVYFNSLAAAPNDQALMQETGRVRSLNRTRWTEEALEARLTGEGASARLFAELGRRLRLRGTLPCFHPDAPQSVAALDPRVLAVVREPLEGAGRLLALHNCSAGAVRLSGPALTGALGAARGVDRLQADAVVHGAAGLTLAPFACAWLEPR